jgi:hypothetical protein
MAAEWKESFDKTRYSNQWEHIYAAGWKAAKAAEALKPSHNKQDAPLVCSVCGSPGDTLNNVSIICSRCAG